MCGAKNCAGFRTEVPKTQLPLSKRLPTDSHGESWVNGKGQFGVKHPPQRRIEWTHASGGQLWDSLAQTWTWTWTLLVIYLCNMNLCWIVVHRISPACNCVCEVIPFHLCWNITRFPFSWVFTATRLKHCINRSWLCRLVVNVADMSPTATLSPFSERHANIGDTAGECRRKIMSA